MSNLILPTDNIQQLVDNEFWGFDTSLPLPNPLLVNLPDYIDDPTLEFIQVMKQPENFYFTCLHLFNIKLHPIQIAVLQELWIRKFPMLIATRGFGKSFLLSIYALLRAIFNQGCKIVVVGAAFRQSKILFEYMENIYTNSPLFQNIIGGGKRMGPRRDIDRCTFRIGESEIIALPIGTGEKIRGMRANYVLADEYSSLNQAIFEIVIRGFGVVSSDPIEKVWSQARIKVLKSLGLFSEAEEEEGEMGFGNQTVISGTAYYSFNHFYSYWKRYKAIIESGGNKKKLEEIFQGEVPEKFDYTHYSVMRIPSTLVPEGIMDNQMVAQARALSSTSIYFMEYGAIFAEDSDGFFKRSMLERCVCKGEGVALPSGTIRFGAAICGSPNKTYVYGIDPASETDNFAIIIIEINEDHRRIVYSWTMSRQRMKDRIKKEGDSSIGFFHYCARKVRDLMKKFPTDHISIDAQGGGIALMEALCDEKLLQEGEELLFPYITTGDLDPFWWEKEKDTDGQRGLHILHMVQFANAEFISQANFGLRKDFEDQFLLFPEFDEVSLEESILDDKSANRLYDTFEDVVMEIEDLKNELTIIQHTQTVSGRDKWDTPEIKLAGSKKGRMVKDRYSALVIANQVARVMIHAIKREEHEFVGGYAGQRRARGEEGMYRGPAHIVDQLNATSYGKVLRR